MIWIKFWNSRKELSKKLRELWWNPKWLSLHDLQWETYFAMTRARRDYYNSKEDKLWFDPKRVMDILNLIRWFPYL